ncbi:hypothetical protein VO57_015170 [Citromicrobium bathyomarinum]|nr:hypothetical protein [Citromicrobium sp. JL2201]KPM20376.1 hypothetical protein VO57_15750 [Citromicrobium sp. JL2201]
MNPLAILSGLLGVGKWLRRAASRLLNWIFSDWRNGPLLVLVLWGAAHIFLIDPSMRADLASETSRADREAKNADDWMASAESWEKEFNAFVADVSAAQIAAAEADRANIARVEAEFAAINERTADDYEARLAGSAAAAERLRDRLARAEADAALAGGSGGGYAGEPVDLTARCQAFGAADCDGLLRQLPWVLAEAQANTDKLVPLQQWVASSALIDFSGNAEEPAE